MFEIGYDIYLLVDDDGPPLSTSELRYLTILTELPFVVSFQERVKVRPKYFEKSSICQWASFKNTI